MYNNDEWKDRVEKWKTRQEKKGLVSKDGGNDPGDDDEFLLVLLPITSTFVLIQLLYVRKYPSLNVYYVNIYQLVKLVGKVKVCLISVFENSLLF